MINFYHSNNRNDKDINYFDAMKRQFGENKDLRGDIGVKYG